MVDVPMVTDLPADERHRCFVRRRIVKQPNGTDRRYLIKQFKVIDEQKKAYIFEQNGYPYISILLHVSSITCL